MFPVLSAVLPSECECVRGIERVYSNILSQMAASWDFQFPYGPYQNLIAPEFTTRVVD